jgi:hypothetical protein
MQGLHWLPWLGWLDWLHCRKILSTLALKEQDQLVMPKIIAMLFLHRLDHDF